MSASLAAAPAVAVVAFTRQRHTSMLHLTEGLSKGYLGFVASRACELSAMTTRAELERYVSFEVDLAYRTGVLHGLTKAANEDKKRGQ